MSLPPTKQDLSVKPAKNGVAQPVDKEKLQKDIDSKVSAWLARSRFFRSRLLARTPIRR
jgi:hypothetical protein